MAGHLFLTGEKRIGKSTVIRKLLQRAYPRLGGFCTVKTDEVLPGAATVHLLRVGRAAPAEENLLFRCGDAPDPAVAERFDRLGCEALSHCCAQLLLMDELGVHEAAADAFCRAVLRTLDGETPVLGVLQKADAGFLRSVAARPDVEVVTVTAENRDALPERLLQWLPEALRQPPPPATADSFGAVVLAPGESEPLALLLRNGRSWSFPKGQIEAGERGCETAVRETWEETGILVTVDPAAAWTVPSARADETRSVTFFLGHSRSGCRQPTPGEVEDAQWVPAPEARRRILYPPDRAVLDAALAHWKKSKP